LAAFSRVPWPRKTRSSNAFVHSRTTAELKRIVPAWAFIAEMARWEFASGTYKDTTKLESA
jgi:hypothetical protein